MNIDSICELVTVVSKDSAARGDWIRHLSVGQNQQNQFVFFLKPEATAIQSGVDVGGVLKIVFDSLAAFDVTPGAIRVLNGAYLKKYGIMDAHYGVINRISRRGAAALSPAASSKLQTNLQGQDVQVLGAHQFLEKFPESTAFDLNVLSDTVGTTKIGGGSYYIPVTVAGRTLIILNPFHPYQLEYFTAPGKCIVVVEGLSNTSWKTLRQQLTGATNPEKAMQGSIRNALLSDKDRLGLMEVSQGINGVHLSAGPVEGMVELCRFFGDHPTGQVLGVDATIFGRQALAGGTSADKLDEFAANRSLTIGGDQVPVFDATEEMDSSAAAKLLAGAVS
jgi:nucleoside diphosphate kinase